MKSPTTSLLLSTLLATTSVSAIGPAGPNTPPRLKGQPAPIPNWKWGPNPFESKDLSKFTPSCTTSRTFQAKEYTLDDLAEEPPRGLLPYRDALKEVFSAREYPGSWDGIDPHGYDRTLLTMQYSDVPLKVREWIEEQEREGGGEGEKEKEGKGLYAVYKVPIPGTRALHTVKIPKETPVSEEWRARDEDRLVMFAPGALYEMLPIWVAEGSMCEGECSSFSALCIRNQGEPVLTTTESLMDLSKYSAKLADGGVIAYPINYTGPKRSDGKRDIEFTVKAEVLELKAGETVEAAETIEKAEKVEKVEEAAEKAEEAAEKDEL